MAKGLFYVAPKESLDFILRNGILTPNEVRRLIERGELPEEVLGISFGGLDSSNFQEYVSMVRDVAAARMVAQQLSLTRNKLGIDPNFTAIGYSISPDIVQSPNFIDETKTKALHRDCYPSEVLYMGKIDPKYISQTFAVRAS